MRKRFKPDESPTALDPLVRLWMLRILVSMGGLKPLVRDTIGNHEIFVVLGAGDAVLDELDDPKRHAMLQPKLKALWHEAEARADGLRAPAALGGNLARLGESLGLDKIDCRLLEWACLVSATRLLAETVNALGAMSRVGASTSLARILDLPASMVQRALGPGGVFLRSGLLRVESRERADLSEMLALIDQDFVDAIQIPDVDPLDLLRGSIRRSSAPTLDFGDYPHLDAELSVLRSYLALTLEQRRAGVNVLLYGPPGTGKTELSRALAQNFDCDLFEVVSEDEDGDPIEVERRLRAYAASQRFLGRSRSLVLFDECSDAFSASNPMGLFSTRRRPVGGGKGWFNRVLETNPAPTFWLTNDTSIMDPALLRRFDMVIEMPVPPRALRRSIAQTHCGDLASSTVLDALAESEDLAPAVLTRAAGVASSVAGQAGVPEPDHVLLSLVNQTLRVQGRAEVRAKDPTRLPELYDPALVNADVDLAAMAAGVQRAGSARLCLYGPPGTGKSAFARWLAQQIGRPLLLRRASDLISKWLGESEQNIARAFREAERDRAVLVLDEVDSFLQERRGAERSWEITQVNEMLTQMEAFAGVFVATTNLIDGLDAAALRRFDLKAKFDFLLPLQAVELLTRQCAALALVAPEEEQVRRVGALGRLTPGDFAAVVRRHAFQPFTNPAALVDALSAECSLKSGGRQAIGFVTQ